MRKKNKCKCGKLKVENSKVCKQCVRVIGRGRRVSQQLK